MTFCFCGRELAIARLLQVSEHKSEDYFPQASDLELQRTERIEAAKLWQAAKLSLAHPDLLVRESGDSTRERLIEPTLDDSGPQRADHFARVDPVSTSRPPPAKLVEADLLSRGSKTVQDRPLKMAYASG